MGRLGVKSVFGVQFIPPLVDLNIPPAAVPAMIIFVLPGSTVIAVILPPMLFGPAGIQFSPRIGLFCSI